MCEHYKYMLQLKPEYDFKFKKTGIHAQMIYLCEVEDVKKGLFKLDYDREHYNLLVKECGKCHICRYKRASIKACQAQSEFKTTKKGAFITLTFGDKQMREYIKNDKRYNSLSPYLKEKYVNYLQWTLEKKEFVLFIKRLRYHVFQEDLRNYSIEKGYTKNYLTLSGKPRNKVIKSKDYDYSDFVPRKVRFMHCGEYGENKGRPHHHAIIFGLNFSWDKTQVRWSWKKQRNVVVHFNNLLSKLWQFGDITTDTVSYQTCNYVARYVTKKVVNKNKDYVDKDIAGSIYRGRLPEYCTQSNRHGLGYDYYMENAKKINSDFSLTFKNNKGDIKEVPLPRYFKELMKRHFKSDFFRYQRLSIEKQQQFSNTPVDFLNDRMLKDRRDVKQRQLKFKGNFESSGISLENQKLIEFNMKRKIFSDLNDLKSIYLADYYNSGFIDKKPIGDEMRITAYKNFEKYRKHRYTRAINDYAFIKHRNPDLSGLMFVLYNEVKKIKSMFNPFKKEVLTQYIKEHNLGFDFMDSWLKYEKRYT